MKTGIHTEPLISVMETGAEVLGYTIETHYMADAECQTYIVNSTDAVEILGILSRLTKHIAKQNTAIRLLLSFKGKAVLSIAKKDEHDYRLAKPVE